MLSAIRDASTSNQSDQKTITDFDADKNQSTTLIDSTTYESALFSAFTAMKAAESLLEGRKVTYSLSRPPGHHAGRNFYHGFCFFNNVAVATSVLRETGCKIAIVDIDVHHGNGTQDIFYRDPNVFFTSLHADPDIIFPHSGRYEEQGVDQGYGTTLNLPFAIGVGVEDYKKLLFSALTSVKEFDPSYIVVSTGFDTHKNEYENLPPLTLLDSPDYFDIGQMIGDLDKPVCSILEGGYNTKVLGEAFRQFSEGLEFKK